VKSSFISADGCPALTITNGNVTYEPPETPSFVGATATYFCNNGFTLDRNIMRTCESANNVTWTGTAPQCNCEYSTIILYHYLCADLEWWNGLWNGLWNFS